MLVLVRNVFFAIRHRPSLGFLPAVKGYGFTRTSPSRTAAPRLFEKLGPCKQALTYWLEGELYEGTHDDDGQINIRCIKRSDRRAEDMEIVEMELMARTMSEAALRRL